MACDLDDDDVYSSDFRMAVAHALEAREFEQRHFGSVPAFDDHLPLVRHTIDATNPALTVWVELGVATGRSTRLLARAARRAGRRIQLHAFDSFQGLPEDFTDGVPKGSFAMKPPRFTERSITLHKGWFKDTLPPFGASLRSQVGFIHADADLYSSTMTAFDALRDHLGPGTVVLFDEFWNCPGCYEHEFRALHEFTASAGLSFEYLGYNRNYTQASVIFR